MENLIEKLGIKSTEVIDSSIASKQMPLVPGWYSSCASNETEVKSNVEMGSKQMPLVPGWYSSCVSNEEPIILYETKIHFHKM